jgi:hypothetical protein
MEMLSTRQTDEIEPAHVIDSLGGTVAVARLCEVSSQAVTQWRRAGIPRARLMYLRAVRPAAFEATPAAANEAGGATERKAG